VTASPAGRLASSIAHGPITCELALGIDATLESTEREIAQVRAILRLAIDGLVAEFGAAARREGVVALQFQDVSDQILANASRRIGLMRSVLGKNIPSPSHDDTTAAPYRGSSEFFQEHP
jgi:hypothetical protein